MAPWRRPSRRARARWSPTASARLVLLAIVVLAAALRFAALGHQSFWLDEAYTERILDGSLSHVVDVVPHTESTPPLYYLLAWAWTRAFGLAEPGVRSFSALAGTLTVPVVYLVGRRLAGRAAALVAAGLVAVHPLMVWYGQEARAYALLVLLCAVTLLALVHLLEGDGGRWWAVWAVSAALAVATHYFGLLLIGPELVLLLVARRGDPWRWAAAALVVATTAALAPLALEQRGTGHADYIGDSSLVTRTLQLAKQLLVGYASPAQTLTAVVAVVLAAFAVARVVAVADRPHARTTLLVAAVGLGSVARDLRPRAGGPGLPQHAQPPARATRPGRRPRRRLRRPAGARRRFRRRRAAGRAAAPRDDPGLDEPALPARRLAWGLRRPRPPVRRARDRREPGLRPAARLACISAACGGCRRAAHRLRGRRRRDPRDGGPAAARARRRPR